MRGERGAVDTPAPGPAATDALVYIYRSGVGMPTRDGWFYVDGVNVVDLSPNGYTWFHIPAGDYFLKHTWPYDITLGGKITELSVRWLAGRTYFYRLRTDTNFVRTTWLFSDVPSSLAERELASCRLQPAFGLEKLVKQRGEKCATCK